MSSERSWEVLQSPQLKLELKGRNYSFTLSEGASLEAATEQIKNYAEIAPDCGYCDEIIFPGSPVIGGILGGAVFDTPYVKDTEFIHFFCIDSPETFLGWINDEGKLTPFERSMTT